MGENEPECECPSYRPSDGLYKVSIDYLPASYRSRVYSYVRDELGREDISSEMWFCKYHRDKILDLMTVSGEKIKEAPVIAAGN